MQGFLRGAFALHPPHNPSVSTPTEAIMTRTLLNVGTALCAATLLALISQSATAQTEAAHKVKSVKSKQGKKAHSAISALIPDATGAITDAQLNIAARVFTGKVDCEFGQNVNIDAINASPGQFRVSFKNVHYLMTPEETSTGAVRLEDKKSGTVWLQIPTKSMLMNHKIGQRMVDGCTHAEQRVAVDPADVAEKTILAQ